MNKIVTSSLFLITILFLIGCQSTPEIKTQECKVCDNAQISEGKGILDILMYTWAINELNNSQVFFDYWIRNFGDSEAKDIKIRCKLYDKTGNAIISTSNNYGNLASKTAQLGEVITGKTNRYDSNTAYSSNYYVESCTNCDLLYKRVLTLVEAYEKEIS